ncbi:glucosaminidase domain-containing protein [Candidatus Marsarchaeota archaeon]|nr:glucosaminidase domain-containing protein [Candidatus Marsarchaeota archaeon]
MKIFNKKSYAGKENDKTNEKILLNLTFKDHLIKLNTLTKNTLIFFKKNINKIALISAYAASLAINNPVVLNNTYKNQNENQKILIQNKEAVTKDLAYYKKKMLLKKAEQISDEIQKRGYVSSLTSQTGIYYIIQLSEKAAKEINVPWKIIFSHWAAESKYFTSYNAINRNNLAGLGPDYNFKSLSDFEKAFVKTITDNFPDAMNANSIKQYADGLFMQYKYCTWPPEFADPVGYEKLIKGPYKIIFQNKNQNENQKILIADNNTKPITRLKIKNFG